MTRTLVPIAFLLAAVVGLGIGIYAFYNLLVVIRVLIPPADASTASIVFRGIAIAVVSSLAALIAACLFAIVIAILPIPKVPLIYNLRNLQVRWLTLLLTSMAIVLVVALLTLMLAFVKGMDRLTEGTANPANVVILADGANDEAFSRLEPFGVQLLPKEVQDEVAKSPDDKFLFSKEVYVVVTHQGMLPSGQKGKRRFCQMRGLEDPAVSGLVHGITLNQSVPGKPGQWFSPTGEKEVVLGSGVARLFAHDVGKETLEPGDKIEIGKWTWRVAGIMNPSSSTFGSEIWVHDSIVQTNFGRNNSYSSFVAQVKDPNRIAAAVMALKDLNTIKFNVTPEKEYYAKLTATNEQFRATMLFVAMVMAIGGVLGVMITMFAAVSQRMRDIGVLRLLGYARWQILASFLLESLAIGLVGGILGVGIGALCDGITATSILSGSGGGGKSVVLRLTVDASVIGTGLVFALVMAALGGILPAINATRLRPLESLR